MSEDKQLHLILHIPTGELFVSCNLPVFFIRLDECVEEYEVMSSYSICEDEGRLKLVGGKPIL